MVRHAAGRYAVGMTARAPEALDGRHRIDFAWLVRLRWWAIAGQLATVLVARTWLGLRLPLLPLAVFVGIEASTNLVAQRQVRRRAPVGEPAVAALLFVDVGCLTGLLYWTGGPFNPFNFLYLVYIALGAVVLRPIWTWPLVVVSLGGLGALFVAHVPLPLSDKDGAAAMWLHVRGMWVASAVAAVFIVYFVQRVTSALARREAELRAAEQRAARMDRLAALATLAAGAAHELATPLSTIAVAARELERALSDADGCPEAAADAALIRRQVDRCRAILQGLSADAGQSPGEAPEAVDAEQLVAEALAAVPDAARVRRIVEATASIVVPRRGMVRALSAIVRNALQATATDRKPVTVRTTRSGPHLRIVVSDTGVGMSADVLARATDPFFTTRPVGQGMGLGLFLARSIVERSGGTLALTSTVGAGTTVTVTLPVANVPDAGGHP